MALRFEKLKEFFGQKEFPMSTGHFFLSHSSLLPFYSPFLSPYLFLISSFTLPLILFCSSLYFSLYSKKIDNTSFENVENFKIRGVTATNNNLFSEEIDSGKIFCHLVQNSLSSRLLFKNTRFKICKTIILQLFLY
jgi:hypothetical protein